MNLGEGIKQARESQKITQKELAELLDVQTQTLWRWEKGERIPKLATIQKIAEVLNAPQLLAPVQEIMQANKTVSLGLRYWGNVVDNMRELAKHGDIEEISLVYSLMQSGCNQLKKIITTTQDINNSHVDITQQNIGHDATVNLGTNVPTTEIGR